MNSSDSNDLSHLDAKGKPIMVDVGNKIISHRKAIAKAEVLLNDEIINLFNNHEIMSKKGPVIQTAIIAGIMAAKKTGELIPLCHPLPIENCDIGITINNNMAEIVASASINSKTGVEMEALTAVSIAALTIYDMCKAISHDIIITNIQLMEKSGGKSDFKRS